MPDASNFEWKKCDMPPQKLNDGDVKIENLYLSVDPAQVLTFSVYLN